MARTTCSQWVTGVTPTTCADYLGTNTCIANTLCYTKGACNTYVIPATTAAGDKGTWCAAMQDTAATPVACIYDAA